MSHRSLPNACARMAADHSCPSGFQPEQDGAGSSGGGDGGPLSGLQPQEVGGGSAQGGGGGSPGGAQCDEGGGGAQGACGAGGHGDDGHAAGGGGDGQKPAGGAGPPGPVEFQLTGQDVLQVHMGCGKWQDADPTWTEPLVQALRAGVRTLRLPHCYQNKLGEEVRSWYAVDCADTTSLTQQNEATGRRRSLRVVQLMGPAVVTPPPPPQQQAAPPGSEAGVSTEG